MKLVFPINVCVLVCLAALTAAQDSTTPREADCQKYMNNACTREYIPLCGDDGVTHSNECVLCMKNRSENKNIMVVKLGKCDEVTTAAAFTSEAPPPNPNSI